MLSDVIVNIFNSHMTLYLNIMKAQGFYILLRYTLKLGTSVQLGILLGLSGDSGDGMGGVGVGGWGGGGGGGGWQRQRVGEGLCYAFI